LASNKIIDLCWLKREEAQFSKQVLVEGRGNLTTKGEEGGQQLLLAIGL
jgi:hypothetical protein